MAPQTSGGQTPHEFFTSKTFYTLAGTSAGLWIFVAICSQLGVRQSLLRWLALAMALIIVFSRKQAWKADQLLVTFFNGLLVYSNATGINAISSGTAFSERKEASPTVKASLLPFLKEKAWWEPIELVQRNETLQAEGAALEHTIAPPTTVLELRTERKLDEAAILHSAAGKQQKAIIEALALYHKNIPYKWGGKDEQGFDSSGYVAYVLSKIGVINSPDTYWSGKLRNALARVQPGDEKVGDVIFYSSGVCMIYLGNQLSIGMLPGGIVTGSLDTPDSAFKKLGVGRY